MYNILYSTDDTSSQLTSPEFIPDLSLYPYYTSYVNEAYSTFTLVEPVFDNYTLSPLSVPSNTCFNESEMVELKSNFTPTNLRYKFFYHGYYNPDPFAYLLSIMKINDIICHNRDRKWSIKSYKGNRSMSYQCDICGKIFDRKYVLKRHRGSHTNKQKYHCKPCNIGFYRKDIFDRHLATKKCMKAHELEKQV